ncbi:MAG TPA: M1 family metallopeptidase [Kofleriaceae bacterium]|nr:M1 family metallopeptidase [Kofleriaceae bacterium]
MRSRAGTPRNAHAAPRAGTTLAAARIAAIAAIATTAALAAAAALAASTGCRAPTGESTTAPARPAPPPDVAPEPPPAGRLGDDVQPRAGALEVDVDPREPRFSGRVVLDVELTRPVSTIWLHASRELSIDHATLTVGGRALTPRQVGDARRDLLGFAVGQKMGPGPARLAIDYRGALGAQNGLFRQKVDGVWYAFTDFEPTDARLALPCFDDPRFKIPWRVSLRVPAGMRAFANAPEVRSTPAGRGWRRVEFAATPAIPTYLLAFAAGPFDVLEGARRPVPIRVIATRGRAALGAAALAAAAPMLVELERYLGSAVPFPKLDLVAVPTFNGAMENPGLMTFAAPILLVDAPGPKPTGAWRDRHRLMAGVVAHELAHLWFGDLVTMRWWNELWLNEGLATWMSDRLMAAVYPADAQLVLDIADKRQGLELDRRGTTVPVRRAVDKPPDIDDVFSPLTYRKGGAIAGMFEAYLGDERMRDGLRRYLAASARGSVTTELLAAGLSAAAGRDLAPALSSFLDQPGVPLVEASLRCGRGRPTVALRQTGYTALGSDDPAARAARRWQVPVCVSWQGGAAPVCTLLAGDEGSLELPADRCPAWIHPNAGERGYYVYALPPEQLRALASAAGLTPREQAGLADDVAALLAAGRVPLDAALDALWSLARGQDELAAQRASQALDLVARSVIDPRHRRRFAARLRTAYGPLAHRLGVAARAGESSLDGQLREDLVPLVAREGDDRALQREALEQLTRWLDRPVAPSPHDDIGGGELAVLAAVAPLAGDAALFDRVLAAGAERGRERASLAMAGFRQPELVARALAAVREDRAGPHALGVLSALVRDGVTRDQALPVAIAAYPALVARLPQADRLRSAVVFAGACRGAAKAEVEDVLRRVLAQGGQLPAIATAVLGAVSSCAAFREHYSAEAARALR